MSLIGLGCWVVSWACFLTMITSTSYEQIKFFATIGWIAQSIAILLALFT